MWILVPQPGIEPVPPTVEVWCLNHRTAREVLAILNSQYYGFMMFSKAEVKNHIMNHCVVCDKSQILK